MSSQACPCVWVVGDIATDIALTVSQFPRPGDDAFCESLSVSVGGCGHNMAITLTKLGIKPALIANVGNDLQGKAAVAELNRAGVDTTSVGMIDGLVTHLTVIVVTPDGERTIFGHIGASQEVGTGSLEGLENVTRPSAVLVSGYALFEPRRRLFTEGLIARASERGVPVILDLPVISPLAARSAVVDLLCGLDTLIVGATEACHLTRTETVLDAFRWLIKRTGTIVIKDGSNRLLFNDGNEVASIYPPAVSTIDSTGAGDVFSATFTAARIFNLFRPDALAASCTMAAVSTTRRGIYVPWPRDVFSTVPARDLKRAGLSDFGFRWLEGFPDGAESG